MTQILISFSVSIDIICLSVLVNSIKELIIVIRIKNLDVLLNPGGGNSGHIKESVSDANRSTKK